MHGYFLTPERSVPEARASTNHIRKKSATVSNTSGRVRTICWVWAFTLQMFHCRRRSSKWINESKYDNSGPLSAYQCNFLGLEQQCIKMYQKSNFLFGLRDHLLGTEETSILNHFSLADGKYYRWFHLFQLHLGLWAKLNKWDAISRSLALNLFRS